MKISILACIFTVFISTVQAKAGGLVADFPVAGAKFQIDKQRGLVYVTEPVSGNVVVIDAVNLAIVTTIPVSAGSSKPVLAGMALSSAGSELFVANTDSPFLSVIDTGTHTVVREIPLPAPAYELVVDSNNIIYASPAVQGPGIMQLDGNTGGLLSEFSAGVFIYKKGLLALSPDEKTLYFGNAGISPSSLAGFDLSGPVPTLIQLASSGSVGSNGQDLALTNNGEFISYANGSGNDTYEIFLMQTQDFTPVGAFETGPFPREIVFSNNDEFAFTVHTAGQIDVYKTFDFTEQPPILTQGEARELVAGPSGRYLFAVFDNNLGVYDILNASSPLPVFSDPDLQECFVEQAIANNWQFAEEVFSLDCSGRGIADLWGLEGLANLTELDLGNNQIDNPEILGAMPQLTNLDLSGNRLFDIGALEPLINLRELDLSNNQIGPLAPLFDKTLLTKLDLSGNPEISQSELFPILDQNPGLTHLGLAGIRDIDLWALPLSDPWTLEPYSLVELDLGNTGISDVSRLAEFQGLQVLNLPDNNITNIVDIESLNNLRELDISNNKFTNIFPLFNKTELTHLNLSGNARINPMDLFPVLDQNRGLTHLGLADISIIDLESLPLSDPFTGIPYAIVELGLANTNIGDISKLGEFTGLQNLDISNNGISDIFVLNVLDNLRELDVSNNKINDIQPLQNKTGLTRLNLSGNSGITPGELFPVLDQNSALTHLGIGGIPVIDLFTLPLGDPFTGQPYALVSLNVSNTQITDISRLAEFSGLEVLDLSGNKITDIFPLDSLMQLRELDLSNNQLGALAPLFNKTLLTQLYLSNNPGINSSELLPILDQNGSLTHLGLGGIKIEDLWSLPLNDPWTLDPYALVELDLGNTQVTDINRLAEFQSLQTLNLSGNGITDIFVLDMLNNLRELDVSDNKITELFPLFNKTELTQLSVSGNTGINTVELFPVLDQNRDLTHLGLGDIAITDLFSLPLNDPFTGTPYALVELDLGNTQIGDINRLQEFPGLKKLDVSSNQIVDISVLGGLSSLSELDVSGNQISNITPLLGKSGFTQLNLSGNAGINPGDLFPLLDQNRGLTRLGLGGITLTDLFSLPLNDPFTGEPYALVELDLSNTQISDVSRLMEFSGLQKLNLAGNMISDIGSLDKLTDLRQLDISNNQVFDIFPLFNITGLTRLNLSGNPDINPDSLFPVLDQNHGLTHLGLADIAIGDLWSLPLNDPWTLQPYALVELDLGNTQISDINRLPEFEGLRILDLSDNQIMDIFSLSSLLQINTINLLGNNSILCSNLDFLESAFQPGTVIRPLQCASNNQAPDVIVMSPVDGSSFGSSDIITLSASAIDPEDGDLSAVLNWNSSIDGNLGAGNNIPVTLSVGSHIITALVTDSGGISTGAPVTVTVQDVVASYCDSSGTFTSYEWIDSVNVGMTTSVSGPDSGYGDYTGVMLPGLSSGATSITLTPGFQFGAYIEHWAVWIDFDHDGVFSATERVFSGSSTGSLFGTVNVPDSALKGETRMRVSMRYGGQPTSCGSFTWGEVEDYTVNILP